MEYKELEPRKPEAIALSFSGGGFRAAAYTLGCLSYLNTVQLGDQSFLSMVNFISSASGGTITNLTYCLSRQRGQSFAEFYHHLKQQLKGASLLKQVFEILEDDSYWKNRQHKNRNIINAFSIAYDKHLFQEATFGDVYEKKEGAVAGVCVNTTEFDNGMQFRFQNVGVRGNNFLHFKGTEVLKQLKLGDILAASSCFTVGFEPIVYPADFSYTGLDKEVMEKDIVQNPKFSSEKDDTAIEKPPRFNLMDGGIDDNQGIGSFMLAEDRLRPANDFGYDLYLCCDVSSNYTSGYEFPDENKTNIFLKPSLLFYLALIVVLFTAALVGINQHIFPRLSYIVAGATGLILVLCLGLLVKGILVYRSSKRKKETFGSTVLPYVTKFLKMRLSSVLQMLSSRLSSAGHLAGTVFLKKIRRISYDRLFEKITERKLDNAVEVKYWRRFAIQNALYLLSTKNNHQRIADLKKEPYLTPEINEAMQPSKTLQDVINIATNMDTTLWFDKTHDEKKTLHSLIAAGEATTCYNLLRWVQRFDQSDPYWANLVTKLKADWDRFNNEPYWLYDKNEGR